MFTEVKELITFIESQRRNEKKETLDYMFSLCELLGNPQNKSRFIHIGGTNGKGSTVTYVKSMLLAHGYHVGTYISPYIVCFNERITYDDVYISDDDVVKYGNAILAKYPKLDELGLRHPSFFEFVTLLAFLYFADQKDLDVVVIEVGIGGRLDCTNVIAPLVSAVTNVTFDHMNILGNTLEEIWDNKLGIVKAGIPFVTLRDEDHLNQILSTTRSLQAPLTLVDKREVTDVHLDFTSTKFSYHEYQHVILNLLGFHQIENAIMAIEIIRKLKPQLPITDEEVLKGLYQAQWPGRLEVVSHTPLIILDGAHNIDAIRRLCEFITTVKKDHRLRLIFAVSANKAKEQMIPQLEPHADEMIFTHFMYKRSDESMHLFELSHHPNKKVMDNIDDIITYCQNDPITINIFCGSLFFVSELRKKFIK
ncbi:MAG: bifunctional folylpolyglutamate synthase/dihydrofolate synthase [Bacilli bacterium]|nr:bifunctional folylpolyglutamate synthase/dihydrofolate synthase [Bacilli bacterium]